MQGSDRLAVTFDVGHTLLHSDPTPPEIYAAALCRHGRRVEPDEVAPVFAEAWAEMQRRTPPGADRYQTLAGGEREWWGAFLRVVLARLGHEAPWQLLLDELYTEFSRPEVWRLYPDAEPCLSELARAGLALAVVSNWDSRLLRILEGVGLAARFDEILVSSVEGVEKPSPAIFLAAAERLGTSPQRLVHVGDSLREDYLGALGAGLEAVLVDRRGDFAGLGYRRIASLEPLPAIVVG